MDRVGGFSLIEVLIAIGLTVAVLAGVFAMVDPSHGAFDTGLETADMQQRLRVVADSLTRDLTMAGAGAYAGGRVGALVDSFPPVLPFRQGLSGDGAPGAFTTDTITLVSVPSTAAQTTLAADLVPGVLTLQAAANPGCPAGTNLCGFTPGMTVIVYDETGNFDAFTVAAVADASAQLTLTARPAGSAVPTYTRGSNVAEARLDVYSMKADAASQTFQLVHSDGSNADVPVADHIVGLTFAYYSAGLVPLTPEELVDGPWRPDAATANRWDADLLRIRTVAATLRVEAASAALRGPAGVLFTNGGTSRAANRWAPDQELRIQVSPRNMNLVRE